MNIIKQKGLNRMNIKKIHRNTGFTLIELLVACFISIIAFTGIYTMSKQTMLFNRMAKEESNSGQAIQFEIERIRSFTWSQLTAFEPSYSINPSNNLALGELNNGQGTVRITPYPTTSVSEPFRAVSVEVSWTERGGNTESNVFLTLIAEQGMK